MDNVASALPSNYFRHARTEIAPFLPESCGRVLEVGCGAGGTLAWLGERQQCEMRIGIEIDADAAKAAQAHADHIECGDVASCLDRVVNYGPFGVVLCLDVLEHLVDPWSLLRRLELMLRPGGSIIVSVPNVRHYKVSLPLLFLGRWRYEAAGVLDRTHLRFFTRESARELIASRRLENLSVRGSRAPTGSPSWFANVLTAGLLHDLFSVQFLLASTRRAEAP